jgi:hypothetical protein
MIKPDRNSTETLSDNDNIDKFIDKFKNANYSEN